MDWVVLLGQIEDHLFPAMALDVWEKSLYYHLLRHTRLDGKRTGLFSLAPLAEAVGMSETKVRKTIRAMNQKGCISIESRSQKGHLIQVLLPPEIESLIPEETAQPRIDINSLDFFTDRKYIGALLDREGGRCFYCLRKVTKETCQLDHVVPLLEKVDNSYRNIVVACHECNTLKQGQPADDFVRSLYRKGLLSMAELEDRLAAQSALRSGELVPRIT